MTSNPVLLFNEKSPDLIPLSTIYDPATDGTSPEAVGKTVPARWSLVIDDTDLTSETPIIKVVSYVDLDPTSVTYRKSTLVNPKLLLTGTVTDRLVDYGNDFYLAFYYPKNTPSDYSKVVVDGKIVVFGPNARYYRLTISDGLGRRIAIGNVIGPNGVLGSTLIPLTQVEGQNIWTCPACGTLTTLQAGQALSLEILDGDASVIALVSLTSRPALLTNLLTVEQDPVVGLELTANQLTTSGNPYLVVNQPVQDLTWTVSLRYASGNRVPLDASDPNLHFYGVTDVSSAYVGLTFPVLVKYFLSTMTPSTAGVGADGVRFLTAQKTVEVIPIRTSGYAKVSVVPRWVTDHWEFSWIGYQTSRAAPIVIPNASVTTTPTLSGLAESFSVTQTVSITTPECDNTNATFTQPATVELAAVTENAPFIIGTPGGSTAYGSDTPPYVPPLIAKTYGTTIFQIDISDFTTVEEFLTNFYYNANPPYDPITEIVAPVPTHFLIRKTDGTVLTATAIPVASYGEVIALSQNMAVNSTVVLEFLIVVSGVYVPVYGVPVLIK